MTRTLRASDCFLALGSVRVDDLGDDVRASYYGAEPCGKANSTPKIILVSKSSHLNTEMSRSLKLPCGSH
jgi:hypothetical protein